MDSEAISAYLTDLQNQVRAPRPELSAAIRVLAEPLCFLGLLDATTTKENETLPHWGGPIAEPSLVNRQRFIRHLLPNHLDFILDNITIDWFSVLTSAQQSALFDTYFVPSLEPRLQKKAAGNNNSSSIPSDNSSNSNNSNNNHQWDSLVAVVSLQTLVTRINVRFNENHSFLNKTILRLLRKLLETYSLMDFYRGCCDFTRTDTKSALKSGLGSRPTTAGAGSISAVDPIFWDSFLSRLFSIPTRISNAFGLLPKTEIEECFQEAVFFKRQAVQFQSCLDSLSSNNDGVQKGESADGDEDEDINGDNDDRERTTHAKDFAIVMAKLLRLGYGNIVVELVVSALWKSPSVARASEWKLVLTNTPSPGSAQLFLTTLIEYLNRHQLDFCDSSGHHHPMQKHHANSERKELISSAECQLAVVHRAAHLLISIGFDPEMEKEGGNEKVKKRKRMKNENGEMIEWILFQGKVFGLGVLRTLICIQTGWPTGVRSDKDSALARTFKRAVEIWSDSMLVSHASVEYQRYISYQLLLMLKYSEPITDMDLIKVFGFGMVRWLEVDDLKRRQIALVVAEEFSGAVDQAVDFNLEDADVQFARSLVALKDGSQPYNPSALSLFSDSSSEEAEVRSRANGSAVQLDSNSEEDEEDPDEIVDPLARVSIPRDDSEEEEDADDLKPYEMEYESDPDEDVESVKRPKVAAPLYLKDLLSYVKAREDRDKNEVGLKNAAELIRRKAGSLELEEFAGELAIWFIQLRDDFELPNFYKLLEDALIALVFTSPVIVAGVLTSQFYRKGNATGQQLNILNALVLGAHELSGNDRPPLSVPPSSSASAFKKPTIASIVTSISMDRTRRFSQKSRIEASRPTPKANAFSKVAPVFLGGLLGRWGGNRGAGMERGYDALQKAPVLVLKKFVLSLGVLVHFAGNSPHLLPITRELFLFLFALRYHNQPAQSTSGSAQALTAAEASLTSLKLPGDIGITVRPPSSSGSGANSSLSNLSASSLSYNQDLLENILLGLLILVKPSSETLSDDLLLHEFYAEIVECQQWTIELWEHYKLEETGSGGKARVYCAELLERSFEILEKRV
ncbi:TEL2, telomere maintenance protein 2 [Modicella reniformis]|uniref:TEL2, telomere maintenance protein 2 n=1 Tax=Modicella reniformis TaxID=1440133 RepID=A0A9P6SV17_9FUNG|nr:TEL2, telomere maintenance protein 2 [Modicella reniformis]